MLVQVLDSGAGGGAVEAYQRWVEGGEEREGIEVAGAEDYGVDVFLYVGVCEQDAAVRGVEERDFGEGDRWEVGRWREGLAWRRARGDEKGWGAVRGNLGSEVDAGGGIADYEDFLGEKLVVGIR